MKKSDLSRPRQRLIELMQEVRFGRICDLRIQKGEPVFHPEPRTEVHLKFGGANGVRRERRLGDFALKAEVIELFRTLEEIHDGRVLRLEVKEGLPLGMTVERSAA